MASLKDKIPDKSKLEEIRKIINFKASGNSSVPEKPANQDSQKLEEFKKTLSGEIEKKEQPVSFFPKIEDEKKSDAQAKPIEGKKGFFGFLKPKENSYQAEQSAGQQKSFGGQKSTEQEKNEEQSKPSEYASFIGKEKQPKAGLLATLEEKWYGLLDRIDEHVPIYKVIDPIDEVVPSFYLFSSILLLLIIGLLVFVGLPFILPAEKEYRFKVVDPNGIPLEGVDVILIAGGKTFNATTDSSGAFSLRLPDSLVNFSAAKEGYAEFSEEVQLLADEVNEITLTLKPLTYVKKTIELYFNGRLFDRTATLTFGCSNPNAIPPSPRTITNGIARDVPFPENCGTPSVRVNATGFDEATASFGAGGVLTITLTSAEQLKGSVKVTVKSAEDDDPIQGATVSLFKSSGSVAGSETTNSSGIALFEDVTVGSYTAEVSQAEGFEDGSSSTFQVLQDEQASVTVSLDVLVGEQKKLFLKFVDSSTDDPIEGVTVFIVVNDRPDSRSKVSDAEGLVAFPNLNNTSDYGFIASHADYLLKAQNNPQLVSSSSSTPVVVELTRSTASNSSNAVVQVTGSSGAVNHAYVGLYSPDFNFGIAFGFTETDGTKRFEDLPPGNYYAKAETEDGSQRGTSLTRPVTAGNTVTLVINLSAANGGLSVHAVDSSGNNVGGANVKFYLHPNASLVDQADTNSNNGNTPVKMFSAGSNVYAVVTAGNFAPMQTEVKQIIADVNQTINVTLLPAQTGGNPLIEFVQIQQIGSGNAVTGILVDNQRYDLKFRMFVPPNTASGNKAVVRTENPDLMNILSSNFAGTAFTLNYYDCVNDSDPTGTPPCPSNNNTSAATRQLLVSFNNVASQFYTFLVRVNIPDLTGQQTATAKFAMKTSDVFSESHSDPASGLKSQQFQVNLPVQCTGANCPDFAFTAEITETGTTTVIPYTNDNVNYTLTMGKDYAMKATVYKLNSSQSYSSLTFKLKDSTPSPVIGFPQSGNYTANPAGFSFGAGVQPPREFANISVNPLAQSNLVDVNFFLEGTGIDGNDWKVFTFAVNPIATMAITVSPSFLVAGSTGNTITLTVVDSISGQAVQGAQVIMEPRGPGESAPTNYSCTLGTNCTTTSVPGGVATFSNYNAGAENSIVYFQVNIASYPSVIAQLPVQSALVFAGPGNLDCVTVSPTTLTFNAGEVSPKTFTVSTTGCSESLTVNFLKIVDSELSGGIKVMNFATPSVEITTDPMPILPNSSRTYKVDISNGACPGTVNDTELCPGEYRFRLTGHLASQAALGEIKIDTIRVFKLRGTVANGYCFNLCNSDASSCLISDGVASLDVSLIAGTGQQGALVKNRCLPVPPVNSAEYAKVGISTCGTGTGTACIDMQIADIFGSIQFEYKMSVTANGVTRTGPAQPVPGVINGNLAVPQSINTISQMGSAGTLYLDNWQNQPADFAVNFIVTNVTPLTQFATTPGITVELTGDHETITARATGTATPTTENIAFNVENFQLLNDTPAVLSVTDHVNANNAQDYARLDITLLVQAVDLQLTLPDCNALVDASVYATGQSQRIEGSPSTLLSHCIEEGYEQFRVSVDGWTAGSPPNVFIPPTSNLAVELKFNPLTPGLFDNVTDNPDADINGKTLLQSFQQTGQNYQIIFLVESKQPSRICDLIDEGGLRQLFEVNGNQVDIKVFSMDYPTATPWHPVCAEAGISGMVPWSDWVAGYDKIGNVTSDGQCSSAASSSSPEIDVDTMPQVIVKDSSGSPVERALVEYTSGGTVQSSRLTNRSGRAVVGVSDALTLGQTYVLTVTPPGSGLQTYTANATAIAGSLPTIQITLEQGSGTVPPASGSTDCLDNQYEAWAPKLHNLIRAFRDTGIAPAYIASNEFAPESTRKIIVVFATSDPTGTFESGAPGWRFSPEVTVPIPPNAPNEKEAVDLLIQEVLAAESEYGDILFYFSPGNRAYESNIKNFWPGGSSSSNDLVEAIDYFLSSVGGKRGNFSTSNLSDFARTFSDYVQETDLSNLQTQKFHVILEAGEESVCYGPAGKEGASGSFAVDATRRKLDWSWDTGKSLCSPLNVNGSPNPNFVYCDAVQLSQQTLNRVLSMPGSHYTQWQQNESKFNAWLIKDGFGADFLTDFMTWARDSQGALGAGIPSELFGAQFNLEQYVSQGKILFEVTCPTPGIQGVTCDASSNVARKIIPVTGFYEVQIVPAFNPGILGTLMQNSQPSAVLTVKLKLLQAQPSLDNFLYMLPFDGPIGKTVVGTETKFHRDGYGVGFSGHEINLFGPGAQEMKSWLSQNNSNALYNVNVTLVDPNTALTELNAAPESLTRGAAMRLVKRDELNFDLFYTPGYATPVLMKVPHAAGETQAEGFFGISTQNAYVSVGPSFGFWDGIASDIPGCGGFEGGLLPRNAAANQSGTFAPVSCSINPTIGQNSGTAYGFQFNASPGIVQADKTIVLGSVLYTPNSLYSLSTACDDLRIGFGSFRNTGFGTASITLNEVPSGAFNSVSDLLAKVKTSTVDTSANPAQGDFCIFHNDSSLEIWFNENYILQKTVEKKMTDGAFGDLQVCTAR